MSDALMAQLGDASWKERKAALDAVDAILTSAGARFGVMWTCESDRRG